MDRTRESGVAIFYILLAVALFAALAFAFTNSMNSSASNLGKEEARIYAQDVLSYANRLGRGVQRVLLSGNCYENDISFFLASNTSLTGYEHTPEADDQCKVFHVKGGSITHSEVQKDYLNAAHAAEPTYGDYVFSGALNIDGVDSGNSELTLILNYIKTEICLEINNLLGNTNPGNSLPTDIGSMNSTTLFTGTYNDSVSPMNAPELVGKTTGCVQRSDGSSNIFYHVLVER